MNITGSGKCCQGAISDGQWTTTIDMGSQVTIQGLQIRSGANSWNQAPTTFKVQGKNSGGSWSDIAYYTLGTDYWSSRENHLGSFEFANDTAYQYYRLLVTATPQGSNVLIVELGWTTEIRGNPIHWYTEEYIVPVMSSSSQDGYVASASSEFNSEHAAYLAFDRNIDTKWATQDNITPPQWLQIKLPTAKKCAILELSSRNDRWWNQIPKDFILQGSNDGSTWTDLLTQSGTSWTSQAQTIRFEVPTANQANYLYYRIWATANMKNPAGAFAIASFTLIEKVYHDN